MNDIIREHYRKIGRKGGLKTAKKGKKYMSKIGKRGFKKMVENLIKKAEK